MTADEMIRRFKIYGLAQDEIWVDADGNPHLIAEIGSRYRGNLMAFIERRAQNFAAIESRQIMAFAMHVNGDMASMEADRMLEEALERQFDPKAARVWVKSSVLYKKLESLHRTDLRRERELAGVNPW